MLGGTGMAALAAAIKDHPCLDTLHLEVLLLDHTATINIATDSFTAAAAVQWYYKRYCY